MSPPVESAALASSTPSPDFTIVGIGASAGGLRGLLQFFEEMPTQSGIAFVVILHLSPKHESNLDKLLQNATQMPVQQVNETVHIEKDHVYVISPAKQLSMVDGMLHVSAPVTQHERHAAIDLFFRTLGETHKSRAMCIVLSGTGSDGTVGLKSVKEEGGITLAQEPDEAEYDSMPRNAIGTGMVDFVLPVAEMPQKLVSLSRNAGMIKLPHADELHLPTDTDPRRRADSALQEVLSMLRARTGHDFAQYKRATVLRRIERRLQVNQLRDLPTYRDYFRDTPAETQPLLKDMLISVTNFFRDRESFETLERIAIPAVFQGRSTGDQVRVWVAGCATGEEAYSVAMLLAEYADELPAPPSLQVFATDIDEDAIAFARIGLYPEAIIADVPPVQLRRFFVKEPTGYRVQKSIREMVMFAPHNLIKDPPFSRVDLVTCRNLLIYLNREIQGGVLDLLHFALRPDGYLLLGTSESIDDTHDMFGTIDKANRLYRAQQRVRSKPLAAMLPAVAASSHAEKLTAAPRRQDAYAEIHQSLLESYAPPSVVVDDRNEIVHLSDSAGQFLRFTAGEPSLSLVNAVHPALRLDVRTALHQAFQTMKRIEARHIEMKRPAGNSYVNVTVHPVRDVPTSRVFALVIFDEIYAADGGRAPAAASVPSSRASSEIEGELANAREQLRATIEQYETQNEELKASNEELQAINEELRAATEELETSKEELQSINEELTTVNQELKSKIDEMTSINNDLQNFIGSTEISVLFVDRGLRLMRFTPPARELFNVIASDIGRPLLDITHRLDYRHLEADVSTVFETLRVVEKQLSTDNGRSFLMRILPYRTTEDRIDGAVLTFVDITERTHGEEQLRRSEERYRAIIDSIRDYAIITTDLEGRIERWNDGASRLFGYSEAEIVGHPIDVLFVPEDRATDAPRRERETARETGRASDERWHLRKDGTRFYCSGVLAPLTDSVAYGYVKIARDLTEQQIAAAEREREFLRAQADRDELENSNRLKDRFLATLSHELRNPLNLIMMQSEIMRRAPDTKRSPTIARAVDIIHQTVKMKARLVDDLLDVSRISTGKLALEPQLLPLPFVVGDSIGALQADMEQKQIALDVTLTPEPLIVQGDPVRVKQIAWNLLSNAVKFTPPGGKIAVRVQRDGDEARLDVEDNGKGISPEFMPRVFELFQQSDPGITRRHSGMGIGLALVRQLVDLQGGRIEAHSAGENKGSRFTVWLPLYVAQGLPTKRPRAATEASVAARPRDESAAAATTAVVDTTSNAPRRLEGIRVLIVEDDIASAEALRDLLAEEGADACAVHSGDAALSETGGHMFDVVVSDIAMPGMDGHELLRKLRENPRYVEVPAIACTGFNGATEVEQVKRSGFAGHLAKPVEVPRLIMAIQTAIAGRNRRTE